MGSSVHSSVHMDESTEVSENPTRDTTVESHPSKNGGWSTRLVVRWECRVENFLGNGAARMHQNPYSDSIDALRF